MLLIFCIPRFTVARLRRRCLFTRLMTVKINEYLCTLLLSATVACRLVTTVDSPTTCWHGGGRDEYVDQCKVSFIPLDVRQIVRRAARQLMLTIIDPSLTPLLNVDGAVTEWLVCTYPATPPGSQFTDFKDFG